MRAFLLVLLLALTGAAQTVTFSFADGASHVVRPDRPKRVVVEGVSVRLHAEIVAATARTFDLAVQVTNLGPLEAPGRAPANVHPTEIRLDLRMPTEIASRFGEPGQQDPSRGAVLTNGWSIGVRDGAMKGATRVAVEDGWVRVWCLENIPEARRLWCAPWKSGLVGHPEEDPTSAIAPTLPGGRMAIWRVILTRDRERVDVDPMPAVLPAWYELAGPWPEPEQRAPRHQALLDSMTRSGYRPTPAGPVWSDNKGPGSLVAFLTQRERRWSTWDRDPNGDWFATKAGQDSLHFLAWPDLWWTDGHTSCHYGFAWSAWRVWLDEIRRDRRDEALVAWWVASRLQEFATTTGICWSEGDPRRGSAFYEKSDRGPTGVYPGALPGYPTAVYKQHAALNAWAASTSRLAHVRRGAAAMIEAQARLGTEGWDGKWGARGAAWGLEGALRGWEWTGEERWKLLARKRAANLMARATEPGPTWWNRQERDARTNGFEIAKALVALCRFRESGLAEDVAVLDAFLQPALARFRGLVHDCGGTVLVEYQITPDGVPAIYGSHPANLPDTSTFSRVWAAVVLGYEARLYGTEEARTLFLAIAGNLGALLEDKPPIGWVAGEPEAGYQDPRRLVTGVTVGKIPARTGPFNWWSRRGWNTAKNEAQLLLWGDWIAATAVELRK